jgi:hypothetical protein
LKLQLQKVEQEIVCDQTLSNRRSFIADRAANS